MKKVLIANRGEIAIRIIRCCKEMGIETVAVYSKCDKSALHTQLADESVCIGDNASSDSYLNMNNIIQAAINTNCDAIHPGFGFLSENAHFASLVEACGLIFIGPNPKVIALMGDKINAKKTMRKANVPVIEGSDDALVDVEAAYEIAKKIKLPIMIKASSGGGGKGMRVVYDLSDFKHLFLEAQIESEKCFNDRNMYIEKYIENPKHVEVQIIGDKFNNVVHLYERDCSFQRRNQKVIEEAPCYCLSDEKRQALCDTAIRASKFVGYDSVGTIEFLLDSDGDFYFMEMNTRIQVEHPITEMVTNVDIVREQIRISENYPLSFHQQDIKLNGYAMECRINAENLKADFRPSCGKINFINFPLGNNIRIESGIYNGYEVAPFYDSMLVKLIVYGKNRLQCIKRMRLALEELIIDGIDTNIEFHYLALHNVKFVDGKYTTNFVNEFIEELKQNGTLI